jgi:hypothetical protein
MKHTKRRAAPSQTSGILPIALLLAVVVGGCVPSPRAYQTGSLEGMWRVAILPLANYTPARSAPEKVGPMLASELGQRPGVQVVDAGAVEAALSTEPWLLFDRIPPDLIERFGEQLSADAILVGAILGYGYRPGGGDEIPHCSMSLRLLQVPGGRVLWSAVHSRDGADGEWLFGLGRVRNVEQLAASAIVEITKTFPSINPAVSDTLTARAHGGAP